MRNKWLLKSSFYKCNAYYFKNCLQLFLFTQKFKKTRSNSFQDFGLIFSRKW